MQQERIKLAITDIDGILRGKYVSSAKFDKIVNGGFGFCNVIFGWDCADVTYDNTQASGWHTGFKDGHATIDLNTLRQLPWENHTPMYLADFSDDDTLKHVCPRTLLKNTLTKAKKLGFEPMFANEYEWFNFSEDSNTLHEKQYLNPTPITQGMFGYSLTRMGNKSAYVADLYQKLTEAGIPIEGFHTETGPGVYEAAIEYSDILTAADRAVLFKQFTKEIAAMHGIMPSFMAKWNKDLPGCGGHIHQSLSDQKGKNLFTDESGRYCLSKLGEQYLAGIIHCLPYIMPMFAPNVNSYKRLVAGSWAATNISWGIENRTASIRVIPAEIGTRFEMRVPGADANPYLSMAACLAAGMYGINQQMELDILPVTSSAYEVHNLLPLPTNLYQATKQMQNSTLPIELFGQAFADHFIQTRLWEWRQYEQAVTNWETQRYFEII